MPDMLLRFLKLATLLLLSTLAITACGSGNAAPTATPTKTPIAAQAASAPTATPTLAPVVLASPTPAATDTPVPQPGDISPFTGLKADNPDLLKQMPIFICVNNDAVGRSAHWGSELGRPRL